MEEVDCKACAVKSDREGGKTGLHIAAIHDSVKLAQILIREGCPPAALDEEVCMVSPIIDKLYPRGRSSMAPWPHVHSIRIFI